ncbi:hypothetical protein [Methanosarcina horonobensis]|uniref:hypothetical protein n=1 Tax=Methanosarcina horonobensis TaxID=418008 RepID=UPI00064E6C5C|nr:hypothetical protein [Methanosarcina horonobensis]
MTIFDGSAGLIEYDRMDNNFSVGGTYYLQDGHQYIVYLKVTGSESTYGVGYACSDAGPWDLDDWGYVKYTVSALSGKKNFGMELFSLTYYYFFVWGFNEF